MGLGKTIQTISFLTALHEARRGPGYRFQGLGFPRKQQNVAAAAAAAALGRSGCAVDPQGRLRVPSRSKPHPPVAPAAPQEGLHVPHMVVVPLSTLRNWERELATWAPQLNVVVLAGNEMSRQVWAV
jgi:SNF2 family DNA or RNA helicase